MMRTAKPVDYLAELAKVQKQYDQYVEVSDLYKLPTFQAEPDPQYQNPSPDNPLTTSRIAWIK